MGGQRVQETDRLQVNRPAAPNRTRRALRERGKMARRRTLINNGNSNAARKRKSGAHRITTIIIRTDRTAPMGRARGQAGQVAA